MNRDIYREHVLSNGTKIALFRPNDYSWARSEVTLPSGKIIFGVAQDVHSYREQAARLGYSDDVHLMTAHHDPLHAILADLFGAPASFSMAYAAGELTKDEVWKGHLEEQAVLACQEYMRRCGLKMPFLD